MRGVRRLVPLLYILSLLLNGCTEVTLWFEDGTPPSDDDDSSASDDDDSSATDDDDSSATDDDDDDSSASDDDDSSEGPCPAAVPDHYTLDHAVWGETSVHFYVPGSGWALATLHASMQLEGLAAQSIDLRLSPSWFFAVALESSYMGCSDATDADSLHPATSYSRRSETDAWGCFSLPETTVWTEVCRMYPDDIECGGGSHNQLIASTDQASTGRDNIQTSAISLAWYITFAYAMSREVGVDDPDTWFATAADPRAMEKLMALQHLSGPWAPSIQTTVVGCHSNGQLESCLETGSPGWSRMRAVASHTELLERGIAEGHCYDRLLWADDVDDYLATIAPLWPSADWSAAGIAANAAFDAVSGGAASAPFQAAAVPVLEAIDLAAGIALTCPGSELNAYYGYSCPP
jgi:hypothetical protein